MTFFEGILLGLTQGLTEFLPVSSTGHLILIREILSIEGAGLAFDAALHLATLAAVLLYFRNDLWRLVTTALAWIQRKEILPKDKTFLTAVCVGTIPAIVFGFLLRSYIETSARSSLIVAGGLIAGSLLMIAAERVRRDLPKELTLRKGLFIGFFQAFALIPGISRSGATISGGLFQGLSREESTRFAFVLSFPILLGAGSMSLVDLFKGGGSDTTSILVFGSAAVAAFVSGLAAIHFLITYLKTRTLTVFIIYRIIAAGAILFFL